MSRNGFALNLPLWQDAKREISLFWTFSTWHVWRYESLTSCGIKVMANIKVFVQATITYARVMTLASEICVLACLKSIVIQYAFICIEIWSGFMFQPENYTMWENLLIYCNPGNFRVGVIFAFFAILSSLWKLPPGENINHMLLWQIYE